MIVDGRAQFVGSDEHYALTAIAKAARASKARVELEQIPDAQAGVATGTVRLRVRFGPLADWRAGDLAEVLLAITEGDLSSNVTRGENAGDHSDHRAVVREFRVLAARFGRIVRGGAGREYRERLEA